MVIAYFFLPHAQYSAEKLKSGMQMPKKVCNIQRKKGGKLKPFGGVSFHCALHCGRAFELWYGGALLETNSPQTSGGLVLYMSKPGAKKK